MVFLYIYYSHSIDIFSNVFLYFYSNFISMIFIEIEVLQYFSLDKVNI